MTLLLAESFDWLETADLPGAYGAFGNKVYDGSVTKAINESGGRNGDKCLTVQKTSGQTYSFSIDGFSFPANIPDAGTIVCGFAFKFSAAANLNVFFAAFPSAYNSTYNVGLELQTSGNLIVGGLTNNINIHGAYYGTCKGILSPNIWYYIEMKVKIHNTTGLIVVKINGVEVLNLANIDTKTNDGAGNGTIESLVLGSTNSNNSITLSFDDVYICDTNGSQNNDFLGDIDVRQLKPNGNGNSSQFVGSDADSTDNYLLVDDDAAPDDDTTYVESATSGNKDTYPFENLPSGTTTVLAVTTKILGKKVDAGASDMKAVCRSSTTESDSAALGFNTSYTAKQAIYELDPNTAAAWGTSAVDSMELGVKVA